MQVSDGVTKNILKQGCGKETVGKGDTISVHCTGYLAAGEPGQQVPGKRFWSTHDSQKPFSFKCGVGSVIAGWDEGCLSMCEGESSRLTIRSDKGYGQGGFSAWGITPNADLIFDIEIMSIERAKKK